MSILNTVFLIGLVSGLSSIFVVMIAGVSASYKTQTLMTIFFLLSWAVVWISLFCMLIVYFARVV